MKNTTSIFVFLSLWLPVILTAQTTNSIFDFLSDQNSDIVQIELETDIRKLIKEADAEEYQAAVLRVVQAGSDTLSFKVKVKARGNTRKQICSIPPVKIKFKKSELEELGLNKSYNKIKCVLQCQKSNVYEQYILREYLAYNIYTKITPYSFKTKLFAVNLKDSEGVAKDAPRVGFFLESEDQLMDRTGTNERLTEVNRSSQLYRQSHINFSAFQYMIGNTDWAFLNKHNLVFLQKEEEGVAIPVPYDFDYSGIVNANYAVPHETMPVKNVRERYYKGVDCSASEVILLKDRLLDIRPQIDEEVDRLRLINEKSMKSVDFYLKQFYTLLEKPDRLVRIMDK